MLESDDLLSCFQLVAFEEKLSTKWLQYTSKAAASENTTSQSLMLP